MHPLLHVYEWFRVMFTTIYPKNEKLISEDLTYKIWLGAARISPFILVKTVCIM